LNQAGRQALALTAEAGTSQVDAEAALEALARLGLEASVGSAVNDNSVAAEEGGDPACRLFVSLRPA
jgi:hypothetical protein